MVYSLLLVAISNALETKIAIREDRLGRLGRRGIMEQLQIFHLESAVGREIGATRRWAKAKLDCWSCMRELQEAERLGQQGMGESKLGC
jgi:hypothetical protein